MGDTVRTQLLDRIIASVCELVLTESLGRFDAQKRIERVLGEKRAEWRRRLCPGRQKDKERPAAFAWSSGEEERRKALLSYLMTGIPYILWDNIPRGSQISCPHIEKSCTMSYYADRKLGVSEMVMTAAASIHLFTGNNIGPRGDLASRSLVARLDVDRLDPENREFKHPDPVGWTRANRAEILQALYTILLGNPTLKLPRNSLMNTRFKMWWRLVGALSVSCGGPAQDRLAQRNLTGCGWFSSSS
jgi:hypothetical protein